MRWSYNLERSQSVAAWLFSIAFLVFDMVVLGGTTRLTGSGLSITQWRPISGAIPPLTTQGWVAEFERYQRIPQYQLLNRGMTLDQFKFIYGWEWAHRLLGRLIGLIFFVPLIAFLALKRIPQRLVWRCWVLLALGGLQGLVGWWMVASGLEARVSVAPERLATHLGLALVLYGFAVWTGLEAWSGRGRPAFVAVRWRRWTAGLAAAIFVQILLGALVAGNHAGLIDTDWPLMGGRIFPAGYARHDLWTTLVHTQAAVQFNHRLVAYAIFAAVVGMAVAARRAQDLPPAARTLSPLLAGAVFVQVLLGVVTLMAAAPLALSLMHQIWAVIVLTTAVCLAWRVRRA